MLSILRTLSIVVPIVGLLAASGETAAAILDYLLDLPADRMLSYRIELEPVHSGTMTIDAEWAPSRVLVFRLVLENGRSMRRSGPSPQSFEVEVRPEEIGRKWTLTFSGLPSRRASSGRMLVGLPDSPDEVEAERRIQEALAEPVETPPMPSWMLPTRIPAGLSPEWEQVYTTTERFRRRVVEFEAPDTYGWQSGMLRYLVGHRELSRARHTPVQPVTREILRRTVALIRELDGLR